MASAYQRVHWPVLRAEYVADQRATYASLATKYGVKAKAVEWHSAREGWTAERRVHAEKVREKLGDLNASNAAQVLAGIHQQHLDATRELRTMLQHKLKVRTADGQVVLRPDVSIADLTRVASAYSQLLVSDRQALGADQLATTDPRNPEGELTDAELYAQLKAMLERHPVGTVQ